MKGIIFNLLEEVVVHEYGDATWDKLLKVAKASGSYTSLGSYADDELMRLVAAASAALDQPPEEVLRWFGRSAMPRLAQRYPVFFEGHRFTQPFLLTLNDVIHMEVRKIYSGADVPDFDFDVVSENHLVLGYHSARKLCALAEGLIEGAASHYSERVTIEQTKCMNRGDVKCVLVCSFSRRDT